MLCSISKCDDCCGIYKKLEYDDKDGESRWMMGSVWGKMPKMFPFKVCESEKDCPRGHGNVLHVDACIEQSII